MYHCFIFFNSYFAIIGVCTIASFGNVIVLRIIAPVEIVFIQIGFINGAVVIAGQQMQMGDTQRFDMVKTGGNSAGGFCSGFKKAKEFSRVFNSGIFVHGKIFYVKLIDNSIGDVFIVTRRICGIVIPAYDGDGMVWQLLGSAVVPVKLAEIEAYEAMTDAEKLAYAGAHVDKAMSIAMYLAFEKAIIRGKDTPVTVESVLGLGSIMSGNPFGAIMEEFTAIAPAAGLEKFAAAYGHEPKVYDVVISDGARKLEI